MIGSEDDWTSGRNVVESLDVAFKNSLVEGSYYPKANPVDLFVEFHEERIESIIVATFSITSSSDNSEESTRMAPWGT